MESLKIYLRSENKIYLFYENEIYFYENQELSNVLENFLEENSFDKTEFKKNVEVSFILHFSYFNFENFKNFENYKEEKNKKIKKKMRKKIKIKIMKQKKFLKIINLFAKNLFWIM